MVPALVTAGGFLVLVAALVVTDTLPPWVAGVYGLATLATASAYRADKRAALEGRWRTSESTLHLLALAGGWPGALAARQVLRHKTVKEPFRTVFWLTVVANCAALAWVVGGMPTG